MWNPVRASIVEACGGHGTVLRRSSSRAITSDGGAEKDYTARVPDAIGVSALMRKIWRYLREFLFAMRTSATFADGSRLVRATAAFHFGNLRRTRGASAPVRYRVLLLGRAHDLWLRTFAGDLFVLYEVFLSRCYEMPDFDFANTKLIVDLGANVGLTTLYFAGRAPQARFICVEPSPANVQLLRRNLAAVPNATVVEAAAAGRSGSLAFDDERPAWGSLLSECGRSTVQGICMDDLLQQVAPDARIDLLKIDIEGAEQDLFAGDAAWIDQVDCIVAELHHPYTFEEFHALLTDRGFVVHGSEEGGYAMPTAIRAWSP